MSKSSEDAVVILLASGLSTRFENGDKLLANLNGKLVLEHVIETFSRVNARKLVVIGVEQNDRQYLFENTDWEVLKNTLPELGQGSSVALAINHLNQDNPLKVLVCLADMPFIPVEHYQKLLASPVAASTVTFTKSENYVGPPALFPESSLSFLGNLSGDEGARKTLPPETHIQFIELENHQVLDIDTIEDLHKLNN
ncbi:nucleotidyltransferase family protein [Hirschia maritima]|uniref:nucleotidyltransferase family protein n=1 Tax=Hirschia maritima TaxID=1121961 RepID=UPI00036EA1BA|nr:nucleotidyltransferase family protein [Hirschia maritima]